MQLNIEKKEGTIFHLTDICTGHYGEVYKDPETDTYELWLCHEERSGRLFIMSYDCQPEGLESIIAMFADDYARFLRSIFCPDSLENA